MTYEIAIFLLEDNHADAKLLEKFIEKAGIKNCHIFTDHALFVKELHTGVYVAVIDHYLGAGIDGFEVLKEVRKKNNLTRVIVMSGQRSFDILYKYIRLGCADYIDKNDEKFMEILIDSIKNHVAIVQDYFDIKAL